MAAAGNYFQYFSEIEDRFQRRRGTILLLSTLDWALIETWKEGGIPLEAVLRGIDAAFDKYDRRPTKTRKVNSLAYCSQEVLAAAEEMQEAAVGTVRERGGSEAGFETARVAEYLARNAEKLEGAAGDKSEGAADASGAEEAGKSPAKRVIPLPHVARGAAGQAAAWLRERAEGMSAGDRGIAGTKAPGDMEELERQLNVLEEKLMAALLVGTPDEEMVRLKAEAEREIAPYRSKMSGTQIGQLQKQFVNKRLLDRHGLPRLSLFYM